jgi:hypothetical protein
MLSLPNSSEFGIFGGSDEFGWNLVPFGDFRSRMLGSQKDSPL